MIALLPHEEWRDVVGYGGIYEVSNLGRVRSVERKGKLFFRGIEFERKCNPFYLHPFLSKSGYLLLLFSVNRKRKHKSIHRLVAEAFLENSAGLPDVNHKNGIKTDNRLENLEWVTKSENKLHAHRTGLALSGEKHKDAKLTNEQVREIRRLYESGKYKKKDLAKMYKMPPLLISRVTLYTTYKYVA